MTALSSRLSASVVLAVLALACTGDPNHGDDSGGGGGTSNGGTAGTSTPSGGTSGRGGAPTGGTSSGGVGGRSMGGASGSGGAGAGGGGSAGEGGSNGGQGGAGEGNGGSTAGAGAGGAGSGGGGAGGAGSGGSGAGGAGSGGGGVGGAGTGGAGSGGGGTAGSAGSAGGATRWVATWGSGQQLTETSNLPPAPGLANNTLRQFVYVSIGGSRLRVRFSNLFGNGPVTLSSVHVAVPTSGSGINTATDRALAFAGSPSVTITAGQAVWSDALDFTLAAQSRLAVTSHFGSVPSNVTGHPGSRTTSYLQSGNVVSAANVSGASTDHWYYLTAVDVVAAAPAAALVTLGDSITDGRGSTTNGNDRWPDALSRRLRANAGTQTVAVVNQGIGGNAVVSGGLGPTAVSRFQRDVIEVSGVKWVIVLEGVNDIGGSSGPQVADQLIQAYQGFIQSAHAANLLIYGVPILPFGGNTGYDTPQHESARQTVNTWILTSGQFDAVIDLDAAVRDPGTPTRLLPAYDTGDHLHLNPAGYQRMGDSIPFTLFAP